jgi:hypothetical protein
MSQSLAELLRDKERAENALQVQREISQEQQALIRVKSNQRDALTRQANQLGLLLTTIRQLRSGASELPLL